jgi:hypothetical protein
MFLIATMAKNEEKGLATEGQSRQPAMRRNSNSPHLICYCLYVLRGRRRFQAGDVVLAPLLPRSELELSTNPAINIPADRLNHGIYHGFVNFISNLLEVANFVVFPKKVLHTLFDFV